MPAAPAEPPIGKPPPGHSWVEIFKKTFTQFNNDNVLRLSAALAYYSVFSIAPLLVITLGIAGLFFGGDALTGQLFDQLRGYVGPRAAAAVQDMVKSAPRPQAGVMATVLVSSESSAENRDRSASSTSRKLVLPLT